MADAQQVPEWTGGHRLSNGEFLSYSKAIVGALFDLDHDKVPIGDPLAQLDTTNQKLTDFVNESRSFASTEEITRLDARRDAYFKAIWLAVEQLDSLDPEATLAPAAHTLKSAISGYKGIYAHSLAKETEEITGLAHDLQKTPAAIEALTSLGMLPWFNALAAANEAFETAYSARIDERSGRIAEKGGDSTVSLRKTASSLIYTVIRRVNVINEINPTTDSATAVKSLAGIIEQYKLVAASHKSAKKDESDAAAPASSNT